MLEDSLGIEVRTEESGSPRESEQLLKEMADPAGGCDLVVAMGSTLVEQVEAAAERHPDQDFAIIDDDSIHLPNVRTLVFDASQPGFLAGYAAASATETGRVGAFGGEDISEVHDFLDGYAAGIEHWNEVHDDDALFVWVDVDGWEVLPDEQSTRQLTSVRKEVGSAVADVMTQYATAGAEADDYTGTLANRGVALGDFHDQAQRVDEQTTQELRQLRQQIIEGRQPTRPGAGT